MDGKVCLRWKAKHCRVFVFKSTTPSNVLPLYRKQTFPSIIWIFTEVEGDGIESRLPLKIFSTLLYLCWNSGYKGGSKNLKKHARRNIEMVPYHTMLLRRFRVCERGRGSYLLYIEFFLSQESQYSLQDVHYR